jgi:ubiquinone/menaquinone biosynthesis C-methylase UbiE
MMSDKAYYGNWLPQRVMLLFLCAAALLFIGALFVDHSVVEWLLYAAAALFLAFFLYLEYAYYLLARDRGGLQQQFCRLVIDRLPWQGDGRALDIGTGNGALAIELAKRFPSSEVVGVDLWGRPWSYSQDSCDENAVLEGVADRVRFLRAGAENLSFDDEHFDAVVSSFVFHAVKIRDRMALLKEAFRVLKKGGHFSFQDLFNAEFYDDPGNLEEELKSWGLGKVQFVKSSEYVRIPLPLRINHIAGNSGVIFGTK